MGKAHEIVGRRVAELRRVQGKTQEAIAEAVGVDVSYVARLEAGRLNATISKLEAVAEALGVPMADLIRTDVPASAKIPRALADAVQNLRPDDVACLVDVAQRFALRRPKRARSTR